MGAGVRGVQEEQVVCVAGIFYWVILTVVSCRCHVSCHLSFTAARSRLASSQHMYNTDCITTTPPKTSVTSPRLRQGRPESQQPRANSREMAIEGERRRLQAWCMSGCVKNAGLNLDFDATDARARSHPGIHRHHGS